MTTFTNLKTEIGKKIQKTDSTYLTKIGEWINRRYEDLWNKYLWTSIIVIDETVTATAGSSELYLPKDMGQIICLTQRVTNAIILPNSPLIFQKRYLDTITNQSDPVAYVLAGESFIKKQLPSASTVTIESSSTADITQKVRVWGKVGGEEVSELLTLTGTTAVTSSNTYSSISRISKDGTTTGYVTIKYSTTTICVIAPDDNVSRYIKLLLYYVPSTNIVIYCTYKKRFRKLVNAEDIIEIPAVEPFVIRFVYSDCLREQRQFAKAEAEENRANGDLNTMILGVEVMKDQVIQMMPHTEVLEIDKIWRPY